MLSKDLTEVAELLRAGLSGGAGNSRANLGAGVSFTDLDGTVPTVANYLPRAECAGMSVVVSTVTGSGTPAAIVGEGQQKPVVTAVQEQTVTLLKHAGVAEITLESALSVGNLEQSIAQLLNGDVLKSFEASAVAVIAAGAGTTIPAPANWVEGVATAQGTIIANGGKPDLIVISAADWGSFSGAILGTAAFSQTPDSPIGALLGTPIHVSSTTVTGEVHVLDRTAATVFEHEQSPLMILDSTSKATTNEMVLVMDLIAQTVATAPSKIVSVPAPTP